jgi:hypothetical protein
MASSCRNLRLWVEDWTDCDENEPPLREKEPPAKRKRLSLPKKGRDNGPSFLSIAEEAALSEKCVPKNTVISTKWAVSNFECWRKRRNETWNLEPERQVPDGLLLGQHLAVSQGLAVSPISSSSQCNLIPLFLCLCHNLIVSTHFHRVISNMWALHLMLLVPML